MAVFNRSLQTKQNNFESKYKRNEQITAEKLRVISELGEQIGVLTRQEALDYAKSKGLDLFEIATNTDPPVARVEQWSKFKFELLKKEKIAKKKNKSREMKEMWFQPMIGKGDLEHKLKRVREFLDEKHAVKLVVKMRGRVNRDSGLELMQQIIASLEEVSVVDAPPKLEQRQIIALIHPGKGIK